MSTTAHLTTTAVRGTSLNHATSSFLLIRLSANHATAVTTGPARA